ncbi:hypothetical protein DH2020_010093 [Rehmannia glutinosa]|uniref:Pectinesterase n=1 Tax=Rehmannia glutinosa TaxID=99300 RepID=A0ABR0XA41_REHGL
MRDTIITGSRSVGGGSTTFRSATVAVTGSGFIARGITFRNTAGPQNHQAVALRSGSDLSVFYRCGFEGYQDTLYVHSQRQFYRECYIYGTVDFIFGNAAVVLQNCMIYGRRPMDGQQIAVTAQGRTDRTKTREFQSTIPGHGGTDLAPVAGSVRTRTWAAMEGVLEDGVHADVFGFVGAPSGVARVGWQFCPEHFVLWRVQEYGSGSNTSRRVRWRGYRLLQVRRRQGGLRWQILSPVGRGLPATGVPFSAGL